MRPHRSCAPRGCARGLLRGDNRAQETSEWLVAASDSLPSLILPVERQRFLREVLDGNNSGSRDSVSYSFRELGRLCRQRKADPIERSRSPSQAAE